MSDDRDLAVQHALRERIKELNLLHNLAHRLLRSGSSTLQPLLQDIADWLPQAMQFPDQAVARVRLGAMAASTGRFVDGRPTITSEWREHDASEGAVEVQYVTDVPVQPGGPFLPEERTLLESVADMLRAATLGMRDAAEQRKAGEALRGQEAQLQAVLEAAGVGTFEWELRGGYVVISDVACRMLAFLPGTRTISDLDFWHRIDPARRDDVRRRLDEDRATATPTEHLVPMLLPDGRHLTVVIRARVTVDASGVPIRRAGVLFEGGGGLPAEG